MDGLPGPLKPLTLQLKEALKPSDDPILSHIPPVKEISDKHKWIVGALASGFRAKEVAAMFGVSEAVVYQVNIWDHPTLNYVKRQARDRVSQGIEDLALRFKYHATEALEKTVEIMRGQDVANARLAAKDIMDRAGYAPVKKVAEIRTEVPSAEFISAVEKMKASDEVKCQEAQWAWTEPEAGSKIQEQSGEPQGGGRVIDV